jgi:hypothetical protein
MSEPSLQTGAAPSPGRPPASPGLGAGRIVAIVIGALLVLIGLGLLAGGAAVAYAGHSRDAAGFVTSGPAPVDSDAYAVVVPGVGVQIRGPDQAYARDLLGTVRIRATGDDPQQAVFLGLARTQDVDAYLRGVGHDEVRDIDVDPVRTDYTNRAGGAPASPPGEQTFWARSAAGTGTRTVEWPLATGDWTVVVMNADGSAGVHADVDLGGTLPVLRGATIGLFAAGGVLLVGGVLLIVLPIVTRRRVP